MRMVKVSDAFDLSMGKTPARDNQSYWGGSNKWITISDLSSGGKYITSTKENISDKAIVETSISMVPKGTIIMSFKLSIGKTAITGEDMYTNEAIMAFRDKGKYAICQDYIYHLFNNWDWGDNSNKAVKGLTLNKKTLSLAEFPLPDFEVQERIAWHLNKVDELTTYRKKQLDELNLLIKSRFIEMFGDPILNPKHWQEARIADVVTDVKYGTSKSADEEGKYKYLRMNNLTDDGHLNLTDLKYINISDSELDKCIVHKGDILFNRTNSAELVGKTALFDLDEPMVIAGYIIRIRLKECLSPVFFNTFMNTPALKNKLHGMAKGAVNQANINAKELQSIEIVVPPISLQLDFENFIKQVDKSRLAVQKSLDELEILKKSLLQQYFG